MIVALLIPFDRVFGHNPSEALPLDRAIAGKMDMKE